MLQQNKHLMPNPYTTSIPNSEANMNTNNNLAASNQEATKGVASGSNSFGGIGGIGGMGGTGGVGGMGYVGPSQQQYPPNYNVSYMDYIRAYQAMMQQNSASLNNQ